MRFIIILCFLCLLNIKMTTAGLFYPICYGICMTACIAGEIVLPPHGAPLLETCMVFCPAGCVVACVSSETTIIKLQPENQMSIIVPINEIVPGDQVRTIAENGTMIWTTITHNILSKDNINITFIDIEFDEVDAILRVTPEHGLIIITKNGIKMIKQTRFIRVGEIMQTMSGTAKIHSLKYSFAKEKYTVVTNAGTILASNIHITTICGWEIDQTEVPFESTIQNWKIRH